MLIVGIALIANGLRIFIWWEKLLGSDFSVIMMIWGTVFGMFLVILGGKGLKNQETLYRFWNRWQWAFKLITIFIAIIILLDILGISFD